MFIAAWGGQNAVWRVPLFGEDPLCVTGPGEQIFYPYVCRQGDRMAYAKTDFAV